MNVVMHNYANMSLYLGTKPVLCSAHTKLETDEAFSTGSATCISSLAIDGRNFLKYEFMDDFFVFLAGWSSSRAGLRPQ